jgi:methyl-accepting chemotaxis protein
MSVGDNREKEIINENIELQKEVKRLREMLDGLAKTQVKILQNAIRADNEAIVSNEETINNGKKMAELSSTVEKSVQEVANLADNVSKDAAIVEKSAKEIESHAENVATTTRTVSVNALAVVEAAEKTNEQIKKNIQSRTNILNAIAKKYNIKID